LNESLFRLQTLDGIELLRCSPFAENRVPHGFTTRAGDFGARENGGRDRERLARSLGLGRLARMCQVHGNDVLHLPEGDAPTCDGLTTDEEGVGLVVESADCVPLLFWTERARAVAAVHAGWRGTLARISTRGVAKLVAGYGADPGGIHVAIGPAIRVCCYEVGDEVLDAFAESGSDLSRISCRGPRGRSHLDLIEANRSELIDSGLSPERIFDSGVCTFCDNARFHSFRKEGKGVGRIYGAIGLRAARRTSPPRSRSPRPLEESRR
jgi:hypothetical protein